MYVCKKNFFFFFGYFDSVLGGEGLNTGSLYSIVQMSFNLFDKSCVVRNLDCFENFAFITVLW